MELDGKYLSIKAQSWIKEDECIKVPHPQSHRLIYLSAVQGEVFERIDYGLERDEIIAELSEVHKGFSNERLDEIITMLRNLDLVVVSDQFD